MLDHFREKRPLLHSRDLNPRSLLSDQVPLELEGYLMLSTFMEWMQPFYSLLSMCSRPDFIKVVFFCT